MSQLLSLSTVMVTVTVEYCTGVWSTPDSHSVPGVPDHTVAGSTKLRPVSSATSSSSDPPPLCFHSYIVYHTQLEEICSKLREKPSYMVILKL